MEELKPKKKRRKIEVGDNEIVAHNFLAGTTQIVITKDAFIEAYYRYILNYNIPVADKEGNIFAYKNNKGDIYVLEE